MVGSASEHSGGEDLESAPSGVFEDLESAFGAVVDLEIACGGDEDLESATGGEQGFAGGVFRIQHFSCSGGWTCGTD